jgi:hypothetical protein
MFKTRALCTYSDQDKGKNQNIQEYAMQISIERQLLANLFGCEHV